MADLPNLANSSADYIQRVNRAIDHITTNLGGSLKLDDVARVACFSPYHFHRVFKSMVGETLAGFVKRVRLERALHLLAHRPGTSLTEVALACGFSSSSDFSRSFRAHYGVPPRAFDLGRFRASRREKMIETLTGPEERHRLRGLEPGQNPDDFDVRVRELPGRRVAYRRVHRPYESDGVITTAAAMLEWAEERSLEGGQWLGYQWEDPEIVPLERCRYDVGLEVPTDVPLGDAVSEIVFPPMRVAELEICGSIELEMRALDYLYKTWLPHSGFAPAHQPAFEAWNGAPFAHGTSHFELRLHLPITDLVPL